MLQGQAPRLVEMCHLALHYGAIERLYALQTVLLSVKHATGNWLIAAATWQINGKQQEAADWEGKQAAQLQQAQAAVQQASAAVEASCDSIAINMQPLSAWLQQQSQPSQPLSTRLAVPEDPSFAAELAAAKQR